MASRAGEGTSTCEREGEEKTMVHLEDRSEQPPETAGSPASRSRFRSKQKAGAGVHQLHRQATKQALVLALSMTYTWLPHTARFCWMAAVLPGARPLTLVCTKEGCEKNDSMVRPARQGEEGEKLARVRSRWSAGRGMREGTWHQDISIPRVQERAFSMGKRSW